MASRDYYDWVHEAMDLYAMDYRDAQAFWRDVQDETGERPTFDDLYDPGYIEDDEGEYLEEPTGEYDDAAIAADRAEFEDYDTGAYDEAEEWLEDYMDLDDWFDEGDEVEVTAVYEEGK